MKPDEKPAPEFHEIMRRSRVTRAEARASAERSLAESADQSDDITPEVYQLLVVEGAPILLALASVDPVIRGAAMGRVRALAKRYSQLVRSQLVGSR